MKHTLFFFGIFTLLTCLSACDNGDKNVIIARKEFVNHVQKTFDDPRTLKEIVDIFPADTISVDKLREMLHLTQKNCSLVLDAAQLQDSLTQDILNINNLDQRKVQRADFSTRIKILSLAESTSVRRKILR